MIHNYAIVKQWISCRYWAGQFTVENHNLYYRYIVELNGSFSIDMLNYWRGMDRDIEPTTFVTNLGKSDNGFMG